MNDILKDLKVLTNTSSPAILKLFDLIPLIIAYDIVEGIKDNKKVIEIDLHFGILYIMNEDDVIKYKFIPSKDLEFRVRKAYRGHNVLVSQVENEVGKRITETYEELF